MSVAHIYTESKVKEIHERNKNTLEPKKAVIPAINQSSVICSQIEMEMEMDERGRDE